MRYVIDGVDRRTGEPVEPIVVDADNPDEAIAEASDRGILTANAQPIGGAPPQGERPTPNDEPAAHDRTKPTPRQQAQIEQGKRAALGCAAIFAAVIVIGLIAWAWTSSNDARDRAAAESAARALDESMQKLRQDESSSNGNDTYQVLTVFVAAASNYDWLTAQEIQSAYDKAQTAQYAHRCPRPTVFAAAYIGLRKRGQSAYEARDTLYSMLQYDDTSRTFDNLPQ